MENIYDDVPLNPSNDSIKRTQPRILYFDCDSPLTLMMCIKQIRRLINTQSKDEPITLYFVKGLHVPFDFGWDFLWNYLVETGFIYNIVFRGYIEAGALTILEPKYEDATATVSFSKDIRHRDRDIIKHFKLFNIKPNYI